MSFRTGACVKIIGLTESMRYLNISLFQGSLTEDKRQAALTLEMKGASNPALEHHHLGKTHCCNILTHFACRSNDIRISLQKEQILLFLIT